MHREREREMGQMEDSSDSPVSLSSLLCREDEDCFIEKSDEGDQENKYINFNPYFVSDFEDEYVEALLQREHDIGSKSCQSSKYCNPKVTQSPWSDRARLEAITWIFNMREVFKFHFCTAYLSVNYFDRFLSRRSIDDGNLWAIRLLSVACLSLAAKMEEVDVPLLLEYPIEGCEFKKDVIQKMELLVLSTLEWEMFSITPFAYLHYFINKFCDDDDYKSRGIFSRAEEFILDITKEISLIDRPPSTIAAAAVLAAYDVQLTRISVEVKLSMISSWGSIKIQEHTFSCYNMMQKRQMRQCQTPKLAMSPIYSSNHSSSTDVLDNFSFTPSVGTKRRLIFSDNSEQDQPSKKICLQ